MKSCVEHRLMRASLQIEKGGCHESFWSERRRGRNLNHERQGK